MRKLLVSLAGSLLLATTAALADPPQHYDRQGHQGQWSQQGLRGQDRHDQRPDRHRGRVTYIRDSRGIHDGRGRWYVGHDNGRHLGWYRRDGELPVRYRADRYYESNWRVYHLSPPPRGYRWVRSDNSEFLLVAIATGIITNIVPGP